MHPSTALATVLVDELVRCGVREVVLCPGSRSAPLAYAVQEAERSGRLRLHVRVDERSAGFLALGLAKVTRRPAVVVTTSGTAVANLHPAVLEAHHARVPMLVLSADRPAELRGTGANQTTVQPGLFGAVVRLEHDQPPAEPLAGQQAAWRSVACRAWAAAVGAAGDPGPAHLNVGFRDPLPPALPGEEVVPWPEPLDGRPGDGPWVRAPQPVLRMEPLADLPARTLLVLGDLPDPAVAGEVLAVAQRRGWPVVAEPFGTSDRRGALPHGPLLLTDEPWLAQHLPETVLTVGRATLSREVGALLRRGDVHVEHVSATSTWTNPSHVVRAVHPLGRLLATTDGPVDPGWAQSWHAAGAALARRVAPVLQDGSTTGPSAAVAVLGALADGDTLVLGSSNPPRDVDLADPATPRGARTVVGNRGLAGIDGMLSTAVGVALTAPGRTVALVGDLTFLHDVNGLLIGPDEPRPDLTVVVLNDDGGGIFATLEHGAPERAADFARVFGTATGADLAALCRGYGVEHRLVPSTQTLLAALAEPVRGVRVLEVPLDPSAHRALRARLRAAARSTAT
ncbi:2-succinyl-5-enolpyruvyl-6-hydroxy-3-cyclohexene-1-carboxylic-acid synthase [Ornithinimicrobium sediminis]|uniref:2-succinyl-5-enolpyruvyl-6-hydroxy-3- cyclohexene-1-carboxylic-acid synthase n=1 Tax=Ornithinimicrobium sediminis TaxID=2904603 RepID=UPI001E5B344C|nr:2-succinyl-5-enolpyruvyl-6-hydroxy-3-cyclohexene-1-carboxylic-acid synthase [Ornithinimicrobium sediminis]